MLPPSTSRLQGVAVLLMSPFASETLGHWLHALTGQVESRGLHRPRPVHRRRVGGRLQRAGPAAGRPRDAEDVQAVRRASGDAVHPAAAGHLLASATARAIYRPDFFEVPTDFWLSVYWLLLCGTLIYLLGYGSRALLVLRKDPRSRTHRQRLPRSRRSAASWHASSASSPPRAVSCRPSRAAPWCGSSPACAAPASPSRRRTRGGSRRSGSARRATDPRRRVAEHPWPDSAIVEVKLIRRTGEPPHQRLLQFGTTRSDEGEQRVAGEQLRGRRRQQRHSAVVGDEACGRPHRQPGPIGASLEQSGRIAESGVEPASDGVGVGAYRLACSVRAASSSSAAQRRTTPIGSVPLSRDPKFWLAMKSGAADAIDHALVGNRLGRRRPRATVRVASATNKGWGVTRVIPGAGPPGRCPTTMSPESTSPAETCSTSMMPQPLTNGA